MIEFHAITDIKLQEDCKLHLTYSDGKVILYDFKPLIKHGGVFRELQDRDYFARVKISNSGSSITFPNEVDFCADALRIKGVEVNSK